MVVKCKQFSFYRKNELIKRHRELVAQLKRHLNISRILKSEACKDLIEVRNKLLTCVNYCVVILHSC